MTPAAEHCKLAAILFTDRGRRLLIRRAVIALRHQPVAAWRV